MKQFHLYFLSLPFRFVSSDDSDRAYGTYVNSRENPEHPYWPDQSRLIREKKIDIGRVVLSVSQRQFSSYLCKYNSS